MTWLLWILEVHSLSVAVVKRRHISWTATTVQSEPVSPSFRAWFEADPSVPAALLEASDAISSVEAIGDNRFEARVTSSSFPLVKLQPVITFSCVRADSGGGVVVELLETNMECEGPAWATKVVMAASSIMRTDSVSTFRLDDDSIICDAVISTSFDLPKWVPVPLNYIQNAGQASIQQQIEGDVAATLRNLCSSY